MRRTRLEYFDSIPRRSRKIGYHEALEMVKRQIKRKAIADGVILDPRDNPPRFEWHWECNDRNGVVRANTRGEARGLIKNALGLKKKDRLPVHATIVKVDPDAGCTSDPNPLA